MGYRPRLKAITSRFIHLVAFERWHNHQVAPSVLPQNLGDPYISRNKKDGTLTHTFIGRWEDDPFMVTPTRPPIPFVVNLGG